MKLIDILVEELPKRGGWPDGVGTIGQCYDGQVWYDDYGGAKELPIVACNARKAGDAFTDGENEITSAQYEAALAAKNDGWIEWDGGERPVEKDMLVDVKFNNGEMNKNSLASSFSWLHEWESCNIIAYRQHKPAEVKTEWNGEGLPPAGCEVEFYNNDRFDCRSSAPNDGTKVKIVSHDESHDGIPVAVFTWHSSDGGVGAEVCRAELFRPLRTEADRKRDIAIGQMEREWEDVTKVPAVKFEVIYDLIAAGKIPGVKLEG